MAFLFNTQITLNSLIICFFGIGVLIEIINLQDIQKCQDWINNPAENEAPRFMVHAANFITPLISNQKTTKPSLTFADFQNLNSYLQTQFTLKNKTIQSLIWAILLFSLIASILLLVTHIPNYIAQNATPKEILTTESYITIIPLILSQFDDIFFPFLLGATLSFSLSFHQIWTQAAQQKFISVTQETLSEYLHPLEIKSKEKDVSTLQSEMQAHVNHLRSELTTLTKETNTSPVPEKLSDTPN